eukprot:7385078-Prymnesium_polylepis.2
MESDQGARSQMLVLVKHDGAVAVVVHLVEKGVSLILRALRAAHRAPNATPPSDRAHFSSHRRHSGRTDQHTVITTSRRQSLHQPPPSSQPASTAFGLARRAQGQRSPVWCGALATPRA